MATTWTGGPSNGSSILNFCCPSFNWHKRLWVHLAIGTGFWRREGKGLVAVIKAKTQTDYNFITQGELEAYIPRTLPRCLMTPSSCLGDCLVPLCIMSQGLSSYFLPFENPIQMDMSSEWHQSFSETQHLGIELGIPSTNVRHLFYQSIDFGLES